MLVFFSFAFYIYIFLSLSCRKCKRFMSFKSYWSDASMVRHVLGSHLIYMVNNVNTVGNQCICRRRNHFNVPRVTLLTYGVTVWIYVFFPKRMYCNFEGMFDFVDFLKGAFSWFETWFSYYLSCTLYRVISLWCYNIFGNNDSVLIMTKR